MKRAAGLILGVVFMASCQKSEVVSPFTGSQTTYALQAGSAYPINGTVVFKERRDGAVTVLVTLTGTSDGTISPVHVHLGNITTPLASVAALLNPVIGKTGTSETVLTKLADERAVTYQSLTQLEACVKVHLSDVGAERDIILAAGNIGSSLDKTASNGLGISGCKSADR